MSPSSHCSDIKRIKVDEALYRQTQSETNQGFDSHLKLWWKKRLHRTNWVIEIRKNSLDAFKFFEFYSFFSLWLHWSLILHAFAMELFSSSIFVCFIMFGCIHYSNGLLHLGIGRRLQFVFINCDMHNFIRIQPFFRFVSVSRLHFVHSFIILILPLFLLFFQFFFFFVLLFS